MGVSLCFFFFKQKTAYEIHTIHLHLQPPEMLQAYEEVKHLDTAAQAIARHPSETLAFEVRTWFGGSHQGALRDYGRDRKSTRLNSSHGYISYAVFCLKKKK